MLLNRPIEFKHERRVVNLSVESKCINCPQLGGEILECFDNDIDVRVSSIDEDKITCKSNCAIIVDLKELAS